MDIWKVGIVRRRFADVLTGGLAGADVRWVEEADRFAFLADPFGVQRDGQTFLFAEAYDYRRRLGRIDVLTFDEGLRLVSRRVALAEPWHLSYPVVFEAEGETFMLPEAHRSGQLTLYRCREFPGRWERAGTIDLPGPPVDAVPCWHEGRWWLFYTAPDNHLHLAFAETLAGPWRVHPSTPVSLGPAGGRPGGSVGIVNGRLVLPVQDGVGGYGRALRLLSFEELTPDRATVRLAERLAPPVAVGRFGDGMHTLSACGEVTLIDVKRVARSPLGWPVNALGRWRRAVRGWQSRPGRTPLR